MRASSFREVVNRSAVSNRQFARDLGMSPKVVQKWVDRDRIPVEHWIAVITAARKNGFKVTADDLARIAAKRA
jgi:DNA-binding transcriptional regulator YiaG